MKKNNKKIIAFITLVSVSFGPYISFAQTTITNTATAEYTIGGETQTVTATSNEINVQNGSNNGLGDVAVNSVTGCAANLVSTVAISALIGGLTAAEVVTNVPVVDPANNIGTAYKTGSDFFDDLKKLCLDPAARALYKQMLVQSEQSVLNWASSGFKGGPLDGATFIQDAQGYFGSIRTSSIETWLSDLDKSNPFFDDIVNAVYQNERSTNNGYTPDLAETILQGECQNYLNDQRKSQTSSSNSGSGSILNGFLDFFNSNEYRTNNPGYQNIPTNNPASPLGALDNLFTNKASAQSYDFTNTATAEYTIGGETQTVTATSNSVDINPCGRTFKNADEKRVYIDSYNRGQIKVSTNYKWKILSSSLQCQNRSDCVVQTALNNLDNKASKNIQAEQQQLQQNNGNTGIRTCVAFIPQTPTQRAAKEDRKCRDDGWRTVTPGSIVASKVAESLKAPEINLQNLSSNGTFTDLLQSVLNGLLTGMTTQLINNVDGLFSFGVNSITGGARSGNEGEFTAGVRNLSAQQNNSVSDIDTNISKTSAYVDLLNANYDTVADLVSTVEEVQAACKNILATDSTDTRLGGIFNTNRNSECNIDPYNLDYKNDPTAGAKLAQNPIYKEVSLLDSTISTRDQLSTSISNANNTLSSLKRAKSTYDASTDPNRDIKFTQEIGYLLSGIPQDTVINEARAQQVEISKRLSVMEDTLSRLKSILNP